MRVIIQRTTQAHVTIAGETVSKIGKGLLLLLGIETRDTKEDIEWLTTKIKNMRIFADAAGAMNLNVEQVAGEVLIVSQFTLFGSTKKGNRPSFIRAARPEMAIPLYEEFVAQFPGAQHGVFGADMQVSLINDGPVTIIIDSQNRE